MDASKEAELLALLWAVESMQSLRLDNIIFESSFAQARRCLNRWDDQVHAPESLRTSCSIRSKLQLLSHWSLDYVLPERNSIASKIAVSVTSLHLYQSYVAMNGPAWLHQAIVQDA
ncbi:hypothetical protein Bca4012_027789 [Brassica carinata]